MTFEFDQWASDRPYPNLSRWRAKPYTTEWRQFSHHWPYSEPPMLLEYMADENVADISHACYIVAVSYFDFDVNWPSLVPGERLLQMQKGQLSFVLYYSEGDNPLIIRDHLRKQFSHAGIPESTIRLISANSAADALDGCIWFADDEMLFRKRNRSCAPVRAHDQPRSRLFTALVRTHKWWRATVMADFWRRGWDKLGYFSYNPAIAAGDSEIENPIEIDQFSGLRDATHNFIKHKFYADDFTSDQHNDHHLMVPFHFSDSYLNVIIETHMDVDQSGGAFLTEKTFKPIKNAQPFVIFGASGSLARLRDLGYRTFDQAIDNRYDLIESTTDRYRYLINLLQDMFCRGHSGMHQIYQNCLEDIQHNQRHFLSPKRDRLNKLLERL